MTAAPMSDGEALKALMHAYVSLLRSGRDRIVSLGGQCDPVDVMERGDPALRDAREALAALRAQQGAESVGVQWQKAMAARQKNPDMPAFSLPAPAFPDYRTGGGGTLGSPQQCIRQDCDCFDSWNCSRRALLASPNGGREERDAPDPRALTVARKAARALFVKVQDRHNLSPLDAAVDAAILAYFDALRAQPHVEGKPE